MGRPPKKSETLEIRVAYETKQAFMAQCRADGVSASEALRAFIESRIAPPAERRSLLRRGWPALAGVAAVVLASASALPSFAHPGPRVEFDRLDANHDARLDFAEFARGARVAVTVDVAGAPGPGGAVVPVAYARDPRGQAAVRLAHQVLAATFAAADRNGDGMISFDEYRVLRR
jgi:H+/Cl- antiporter ClcA